MNTAAQQLRARVVDHFPISAENYRLRMDCPEIADAILPGQFFMLRGGEHDDPLLGRPFALYDTVDEEGRRTGEIDVGIHVVGKMTALLERLSPGSELEIWGPLGNGFPILQADRVIEVAGGIGYTPFVAVNRELLANKSYGSPARNRGDVAAVDFIYGARSEDLLADVSDWSDLPGLTSYPCTDDGSRGYHGFVTDILQERLATVDPTTDRTIVLTCGPLPMMQAVAKVCAAQSLICYASLETPMACGYGACFSCVVPVHSDELPDGWDYVRSCLAGPVFRGDEIRWDQFGPALH